MGLTDDNESSAIDVLSYLKQEKMKAVIKKKKEKKAMRVLNYHI